MNNENYIRFIAALPAIQSAIQISGQGDGALVKIEVPQSEITAILDLQKLSGEIFEVVIIPLDKKVVSKKIKFLKDIDNESGN
jgi:hypothetical protein